MYHNLRNLSAEASKVNQSRSQITELHQDLEESERYRISGEEREKQLSSHKKINDLHLQLCDIVDPPPLEVSQF